MARNNSRIKQNIKPFSELAYPSQMQGALKHYGKAFKKLKGFTLIELLVTIAIVGILAAFAIQSMQGYIQRARYSSLVAASGPYRKAVDLCYQLTNQLNNCSSGQNGIPQDFSSATGPVAYIFTLSGGQIYVFPNNVNGFNLLSDYYTLTPTITNQHLIWNFGGPGAQYL